MADGKVKNNKNITFTTEKAAIDYILANLK